MQMCCVYMVRTAVVLLRAPPRHGDGWDGRLDRGLVSCDPSGIFDGACACNACAHRTDRPSVISISCLSMSVASWIAGARQSTASRTRSTRRSRSRSCSQVLRFSRSFRRFVWQRHATTRSPQRQELISPGHLALLMHQLYALWLLGITICLRHSCEARGRQPARYR
jgi:hypothetical protein